MSKGSENLLKLLKEFLGEELKVIPEYHVGHSLRLDFYLPQYNIGFEFHGEQHGKFSAHFHGDAAGFRESKKRDSLKQDLCAELGIACVVFWFDEDLTIELLRDRMFIAFQEAELYEKKVSSKDDKWKALKKEYYLKQKEKAKALKKKKA